MTSKLQVVGATAAGQLTKRSRRPGRASMSFSVAEAWLLDRIFNALQQGQRERLMELAGDPLIHELARKALTLRVKSKVDSERAEKPETPALALVSDVPEASE